MKTVMLLRHAKSSWDEPYLPDHLRPLAPRGRKAAPRMGVYMDRNELRPDIVFCSSARRAAETWELVSGEMEAAAQTEVRDDLYHASPGDLFSMLQELPETESSVLFVGHNPAMEDLALALVETGHGESWRELGRKFPTGALAVIEFPVGRWSEIQLGAGHIRAFIRPRTLKP